MIKLIKNRISGYGRFEEVFTYIYSWLLKQKIPEKKFVIFSLTRTGSKLLSDLIRCNPDVYCDKEIFKRTIPLFPERYIFARASRKSKPVYGFQLKVQQLLSVKRMDGIEFFRGLPAKGWKIIHIRRQNLLRGAISELIAWKTGKWHRVKDEPLAPLQSVRINCNNLLSILGVRQRLTQQEIEILADLPHLSLSYEDELLSADSHQVTLNKIFKYLDIAQVPVKAYLARTSTDDLSKSVENYNEVVSVLKKTEYAKYLN